MNPISFKQAKGADLDEVLEMMREYYAFDDLQFDVEGARPALKSLIENKSFGRVWTIGCGTEHAGYLVLTFGYSLEFHGRFGLIDELYLRSPFRNRGIGSKALAFAQHHCESSGIPVLRLEVERVNLRARAAYRNFGFETHDRFLMTKWLSK